MCEYLVLIRSQIQRRSVKYKLYILGRVTACRAKLRGEVSICNILLNVEVSTNNVKETYHPNNAYHQLLYHSQTFLHMGCSSSTVHHLLISSISLARLVRISLLLGNWSLPNPIVLSPYNLHCFLPISLNFIKSER